MILVEESVYDPLREYLFYANRDAITLSFADIERVLARPLPPSARKRRAWWSNNASGHVQAEAWIRSNYRTADVDLTGERVTFLRQEPAFVGFTDAKQVLYAEAGMEPPKEAEPRPGKRTHPAFGSLKGTSIVVPGYDLTQPTSLLLEELDGR